MAALPLWLKSQDLRTVLELLYFASNLVLVVIAAFGLRQLRLAKEALNIAKQDILIRSRREAVQLAAERCEKYAREVLPRYTAGLQTITNNGIDVRTWNLQNTEFRESSFAEPVAAGEWAERLISTPAASAPATAILNDLEAFAIYFVSGAADEETAYPVTGALFCSIVAAFSPYLVKLREKHVANYTSGPFQNTIALYKLWYLRSRQKELEEQANKINLELAGAKLSGFPYIGSK